MENKDIVEVHVIGQVTSDVEVKTSASGVKWLNFTTESDINGSKIYNRFSAFEDTAEQLAQNVRKGKHIKILGKCSNTKNKKTGYYATNLIVEKFVVLADEIKEKVKQYQQKPQPQKADVPTSDDLPF